MCSYLLSLYIYSCTIWIVSIKHTTKKLSKYLIPIGWGVSLLWALLWTIIRSINGDPSILIVLFSTGVNFGIPWSSFGPMAAIILINIALLIASLFKVWLAIGIQSSQQGELKSLRKVVISGILLIPALGLPFLSLIPLQFKWDEHKILAFLIVFLINSPIGIIQFILITCQLRETIIRKHCYCCCRITAAQVAPSPHLNIIIPKPKQKNHQTVY